MFFANSPEVGAEHLRWIIENTATGKLVWGRADGGKTAIGTDVFRILGDTTVSEMNIRSVRIGYVPPEKTALNYLSIFDAEHQLHDVDSRTETRADVLVLARRTLFVAQLAVKSEDGTIESVERECSACESVTPHLNLYTSVYDIPQTVLAGSERCQCAFCGTNAEPQPA